MKRRVRFILLLVILLTVSYKGFCQSATQLTDTLKVKETAQTADEVSGKNTQGSGSVQSAGSNAAQMAKQVRNGRPDMTRSTGARPPVIVRPSGSGIPKGVGKPGGAGRKGGR